MKECTGCGMTRRIYYERLENSGRVMSLCEQCHSTGVHLKNDTWACKRCHDAPRSGGTSYCSPCYKDLVASSGATNPVKECYFCHNIREIVATERNGDGAVIREMCDECWKRPMRMPGGDLIDESTACLCCGLPASRGSYCLPCAAGEGIDCDCPQEVSV